MLTPPQSVFGPQLSKRKARSKARSTGRQAALLINAGARPSDRLCVVIALQQAAKTKKKAKTSPPNKRLPFYV